MPQLVPAALVAPTRPGLVAALNIGYRVRSMAGTYGTFVVATASNSPIVEVGTGYYLVTAGVSIADAGGVIEWWTNNSGTPGSFLSAVAVDPVPSNFTDMAITASTGQVTAASVQGNVTGSVASVTNPVTAGTVTDKTGYSLAQAFPTNFASLAITAGGAVTAGTVTDKTGYSLSGTQTFNLTGNITGNLSGSVGSVTGSVGGSVGFVTGAVGSVNNPVTVGTNNDKTGYSLATAPPTAAQNAAATWTYATGDRALTGTQATEIAKIQGIRDKTDNLPTDPADQSLLIDAINTRASQASVDTKASQSSVDTVQAGVNAIPTTPLLAANYTAPDNAGIAAIKAKTDNLPSDPADQSLIEAAISALPSAATIADTVWAEPLVGYTTEGTAGKKLADTATPTNIPPGLSAQQVWEYATRELTGTQASNLAAIPNIPTNPLLASNYTPPPSAATIADAVWDETLSQHLGVGSTGAKLNLASTLTVGDIPSGLSAQQVWEYATRTLSVASGLTNAQEIKLNELHRKAGLDPAAPVTRTLNSATGNVAETFTGVAINHVETGTTVVTTRQQP